MPSQSARENATNSELDAKQIVTNSGLTSAQRDELIEQYVEIVVDSLDHRDLIQIVSDSITDYVDSLSDIELKEEIDNRDDDLYDELVDNITNTDPILYNTNGGKS